jgi:hypothetical protein
VAKKPLQKHWLNGSHPDLRQKIAFGWYKRTIVPYYPSPEFYLAIKTLIQSTALIRVNMKYTLLLFVLFFSLTTSGQSITGLVLENSKPLSLVNLSLLKAKDSTIDKSAISDDKGYYRIENVEPGSYILKASRVGYKQQFLSAITINTGNNDLQLPVLSLLPVDGQLKEVTITGKRQLIEQKIDRMIVNVANTIVASGGNVLDILEKSPGITIDRQNDQIIFKGKEGVIIQIDGKPTYLSIADAMTLLRSMPADNIDRIELITNPSAKYDAAGNSGIIDIRMKKNNSVGTNGSFSVSVGTGKYARLVPSFQVNHRTKKINLFGNYSYSRDGNYWNFDLNRKQRFGSEFNYIRQLSPIRFKNRSHNAKAGLDLFINKKLTAGIVWTGLWNSSAEKSPADAVFSKEPYGAVFLHTLTDKSLSTVQSNHLVNLNIVQVFSGKSQLSADIDVGRFKRQFSNYLVTDTLFPGSTGDPVSNLLSQMPTTIDIISFKLDYTTSIANNWKMEAGIKASRVNSDNDMQLSSGTNGNLAIDSQLSNHFKYEENIKAAYISVSGKMNKKTDILLGLRTEYTHSIANAITQKNRVPRNYLNFFPSLFITHTINENNSVSFSYSHRIDRPNYQSLNPSRSYIDPFAYSEGNPFLTPQFTHSLEIRHGLKNKIFTSLGASFINDFSFFLTKPVDDKSTRRMPENIGSAQAYNMTVSFPATIVKGWVMQTSLIGIYNQFRYLFLGTIYHPAQIGGRFTSTHSIIMGKGWTGEISGRLNTPSINANFRSPWLGTMDLGIQKTFPKTWKAKLNFQDVFHSTMIKVKAITPEFENRVQIMRDTRVVMLTISRSFGNQQVKSSRQRKTASEDEIQRTN